MNKLNKRLVRDYKLFKKKYCDDREGYGSYAFSSNKINKLWLLKFYNNESNFSYFYIERFSSVIREKFYNNYDFFKNYLFRKRNIIYIVCFPEHNLISLEILEYMFDDYEVSTQLSIIERFQTDFYWFTSEFISLRNKYEILKLEKQLTDDLVGIENKTTLKIKKF